MVQYFVVTKNDKFEGKLCGVKFSGGQAYVDERTIPKDILKGRTVDDIARQLVEEHGCISDPAVPEPPKPAPKTAEPPKEASEPQAKPKRAGDYKAG